MRTHRRLMLRTAIAASVIGSFFLTVPGYAAAQTRTGFLQRVYRDEEGDHKYQVFLPRNYHPRTRWPVILFLHGAGERGTDGVRPTLFGLGPAVKLRRDTFPFVVVFPQCEDIYSRALGGWRAGTPDARRALRILEEVEEDFSIDPNRRILTGWSMGGYGAWSLAAAHPQKFAAVVPVAGGGDPDPTPTTVESLKGLPLWAFHGSRDRAILPERSREMVEALEAAGGQPRYTEIPDAGHEVWKLAYDSDLLINWMQNPRAGDPPPPAAFQSQDPRRLEQLEGEFLPAVEIPRALQVRIGNETLKSASYSIPHVVPREALTGRVDDMTDTTVTEGRTFQVYFSRISYQADLARAAVRTRPGGNVLIQLGLQNAALTIGRTDVVGRKRSAVAGPIQVVLGHRRPVWLSFEVKPLVRSREISLQLGNRFFDIPEDNWYVSEPAGVSTEGLGMTSERVSRGLVSGLYGSKARIEREVLSVVPNIVAEIEEDLKAGEVSRLAGAVWPLPVLQPRIRLRPERVDVDEQGITASFAMAAAALDPLQVPQQPERIEIIEAAETLPKDDNLQVGLAPNVLQPLTKLAVDAELAQVHVLDIPGEAFAPFVDRQTLAEAIPELGRLPDDLEIRSVIILNSPLSARPARETGDHAVVRAEAGNAAENVPEEQNTSPRDSTGTVSMVEFRAPQLTIAVFTRSPSKNPDWKRFAEFDFSVTQNARMELARPDFQTRRIVIQWVGDARITAETRFAPGYQPENDEIHTDRIAELFASGWRTWTQAGPVADADVPDLDFGYSSLRLENLAWERERLWAGFGAPGVKITNSSDQPLVYETRGPYSGWGGPYTLEPGGSHQFDIPYPLLFRRRLDSRFRTWTLPVGAQFEFRVPRDGGPSQLFQGLR